MAHAHTLPKFATFGEMLHYWRRSAQMSQRELAIAVGYSEGMISRLEHDERPPDVATVHALFVPALHLDNRPEGEVNGFLRTMAAAAEYRHDPRFEEGWKRGEGFPLEEAIELALRRSEAPFSEPGSTY